MMKLWTRSIIRNERECTELWDGAQLIARVETPEQAERLLFTLNTFCEIVRQAVVHVDGRQEINGEHWLALARRALERPYL
jgi:hypothetical protein